MPDIDRASNLVQEALDQFDAPGMTVAALTRRCQRIARFVGERGHIGAGLGEGVCVPQLA